MAFLQANRELTQADLFALSNVVKAIEDDPAGVNRLLIDAGMVPAERLAARSLQLVALSEAVGPDLLITTYQRESKFRSVVPLVAAALKGLGSLIGSGLFKGGKNKAEMQAMAEAFLVKEKQKLAAQEEQKVAQRLADTEAKKEGLIKNIGIILTVILFVAVLLWAIPKFKKTST